MTGLAKATSGQVSVGSYTSKGSDREADIDDDARLAFSAEGSGDRTLTLAYAERAAPNPSVVQLRIRKWIVYSRPQ